MGWIKCYLYTRYMPSIYGMDFRIVCLSSIYLSLIDGSLDTANRSANIMIYLLQFHYLLGGTLHIFLVSKHLVTGAAEDRWGVERCGLSIPHMLIANGP